MTNNEKAYKEAEKELQEEKVKEIKEVMKSILQDIEDQKDKKAKIEDRIRLLKLDLEDLQAGKLDKIKERHLKSTQITPKRLENLVSAVTLPQTETFWSSATSGTYLIANANGTYREFYF